MGGGRDRKQQGRAMNWIRRIVLALGMGFALVASAAAFFMDEPAWFKDAIYMGTDWLLCTLVLLAVVSEAVTFFFRYRWLRGFLVAVAVAATIAPVLYLNAAVFLARGEADFQTWHLLPLFQTIYQVAATFLAAVVFVAISGLTVLVRVVASRLRPTPGTAKT